MRPRRMCHCGANPTAARELQSAEHSGSVAGRSGSWSKAIRMRQAFKILGLLLLLTVAQQGAVVHELSHVVGASHDELQVQTDGPADNTCALCPAFAQVVAPAFSHSFQIPFLVRVALQRVPELRYAVVDAAVPRPRSRGPPSLS